MGRCLYKYYDNPKWADAFLDGELLFRSLAYFRDCEDKKRQDQNEGKTVFRPEGGLLTKNLTQGRTMLWDGAFESSVEHPEEIFVFCMSRSLSDDLRREFNAEVCVEVQRIGEFCDRIQAALPPEAKFPGLPGRTRIGHRVEYYQEADGGKTRWALPDQIAISKVASFAWQDEFRLVFCLTDAMGVEKVRTQLVRGSTNHTPQPEQHRTFLVKAMSLRDICKVRVLSTTTR
jgi:hypothetical protein